MKCFYIAVLGFRSEAELRAYLYSHADVYEIGQTIDGRLWAIVEVAASMSDAQYQADRLQSGMMGVRVYDAPLPAAVNLLSRL